MGFGLIDNAERLYSQVVAADPHNSIAVTGLARVALERGDQRGAYTFARRALAIDPDNPVAGHLAHRMAEQLRMRGETLPGEPAAGAAAGAGAEAAPRSGPPDRGVAPAGAAGSARASATDEPPPASRSGIVDRLLRRRR